MNSFFCGKFKFLSLFSCLHPPGHGDVERGEPDAEEGESLPFRLHCACFGSMDVAAAAAAAAAVAVAPAVGAVDDLAAGVPVAVVVDGGAEGAGVCF